MCNDQVPEGYVFDNMFYNWQVFDTVSAPHTLTSALEVRLLADDCLLAARCMHSSQLHAISRRCLPCLPAPSKIAADDGSVPFQLPGVAVCSLAADGAPMAPTCGGNRSRCAGRRRWSRVLAAAAGTWCAAGLLATAVVCFATHLAVPRTSVSRVCHVLPTKHRGAQLDVVQAWLAEGTVAVALLFSAWDAGMPGGLGLPCSSAAQIRLVVSSAR